MYNLCVFIMILVCYFYYYVLSFFEYIEKHYIKQIIINIIIIIIIIITWNSLTDLIKHIDHHNAITLVVVFKRRAFFSPYLIYFGVTTE